MANKKEFAPGIYSKTRFERIPTVDAPQEWDAVIHAHSALKAGKHFDLRLLEPGTDNLHSWALRRLPKPGQKVLAIQQPTHSSSYKGFSGEIPKGYGAGTVSIHSGKAVKVRNASPTKITFERGRELFTLVKTKPKGNRQRDWLLINRTKTASVGSPGVSNNVVALLFTNMLRGTKFSKMVKGKKG